MKVSVTQQEVTNSTETSVPLDRAASDPFLHSQTRLSISAPKWQPPAHTQAFSSPIQEPYTIYTVQQRCRKPPESLVPRPAHRETCLHTQIASSPPSSPSLGGCSRARSDMEEGEPRREHKGVPAAQQLPRNLLFVTRCQSEMRLISQSQSK